MKKKAVMVFIHGGAFNFGSGSLDFYSPDYLLDENVIVITLNYRLNVLGFLNLGIDDCSGNMGLKDQLFALKWIKENISAFGGDANNITIFGESAGSASVHCHILSPKSTGMFQKAIMQSGCVFNPWALNEKHSKDAALLLAKKFGCEEDDPKNIIQYLLNIPAIDLVKFSTTKISFEDERNFLNYQFIPSIESDEISDSFLPAHPEILMKTANPIPIITGVNNLEGMVLFAEHRLTKISDFHKAEEISKLFDSYYNKEIINKIQTFYFDGHIENQQILLEKTCDLFSDVFFTKDFHRSFYNILEKNVVPIYNYEFKFHGDLNLCKKLLFSSRPMFYSLKGACHADELHYLFYGQLLRYGPKSNSQEYRMCRTLSKMWSNFAKTGNPNSSDLNVVWCKTSLENPKYLSIDGDNTCMIDGLLNSTRVKFWENIIKTVQLKQKL